jgi:hypothetical protein
MTEPEKMPKVMTKMSAIGTDVLEGASEIVGQSVKRSRDEIKVVRAWRVRAPCLQVCG